MRTVRRSERSWKVNRSHLGSPVEPAARVADLVAAMPRLLAADGLRAAAAAIAHAHREGGSVVALVGAHVVKCGLGPLLSDLVRRRVLTAIAMNGAGAIHDFEMARWGETSENVDDTLVEGTFGLVEETGREMNALFAEALQAGLGMGEGLGRGLIASHAPFAADSLLAAGHQAGIPVTVHVAVGTDVIHQHPTARGDVIGALTMDDFRILAAAVAALDARGVVLNLGSAVILPEVFLKCVSTARNLGHAVQGFTAVNLDMIQHYRPSENVLRRPTSPGGHPIAITGHHEIMIPLLAACVLDALAESGEGRGPARVAD
jgi:deoxyhypusine synthase